jgi:hypothetical protein
MKTTIMKWKYAVTWESMTQPPLTYRGEVDAGSPSAAVSGAVRAAKQQGRVLRGYCSLLVLLDREVPEDEADTGSDEL